MTRHLGLPAFLILGLFFAMGGTIGASSRRVFVNDEAVATLEGGNRIFLEVVARPRDSYVSLAVRWAGTERAWARLEEVNDRRKVTAGLYYAIPFDVLDRRHAAQVLVALFPDDGPSESGWVHRVAEQDLGQTLESIALWFSGEARHAGVLAESNGIAPGILPAGTEVVIPDDLVPADLAGAAAERHLAARPAPVSGAEPAAGTQPPPGGRAPRTAGDLLFKSDAKGDYAVYRLKRGEALYSAVVVRYTGRLSPQDVAAVTATIAEMSGIQKPDSIPVGYPIKIPRHLILPEFLPADDPRRAAHDTALDAAQRHEVTAKAQQLDGVAIILDSGHGGDDIGAQRNGIHEDDYVYDIMCRLRALAMKETGARVFTTIKDKSAGFTPHDGPFPLDKDEYLLTTPVYHPRKPHVGTAGVNLRWYLVNSYYRALRNEGFDPQRVIFISLHADSRHPAVRGAMVYVPGQDYRDDTYGHVGKLYKRKEVEEARYVSFSPNQRTRSEGLSRHFAARVIDALRGGGVPIHAEVPVRDHVIRGRREYAPAVIRASLVPQSILLEIVNINNADDAALLKRSEFRQTVARALLDAIEDQYAPSARGPVAVTTAR